MKNFRKLTLLFAAFFIYQISFAQAPAKEQLLTFEQFEVKLKAAGKSAQILDARLLEEYEQNHLEGAVSFNTTDKAGFDKESAKLDKAKPVFIYSIANGRSVKLAEELRAVGFQDVTVVPGGLSGWVGRGKPVVSTVGKGLNLEEYKTSLNSEKLVLVNFGSRYCGSCKKQNPIVDSVKKENTNSLKVVRIEAYENKDLTKELGVIQLPTLILYKNNQIVWKKTGVASKAEIEQVLKGQTL